MEFNARKSISKKTSLNIPAKLQSILSSKNSNNVVTHKYIKPAKVTRLNESVVSKGSRNGKDKEK